MGLTVEQLDLEPDVAAKAHRLQFLHPGVVFTSGRRTLAQQAQAMAENIAEVRSYVVQTYAPSVAATRCQRWVDEHPQARTADELATGLLIVLHGLALGELGALSRHLSGRAFDIEPGTCPVSVIETLGPRKVLTHEAGLPRLHVEF